MDVRFWEEKNNREEDRKKENYCPKKVTCAQKKGSNDIHEKQVDAEKEDEDEDEDGDENCPKKVTCAQKKSSNDIHEKQVGDEYEGENEDGDENYTKSGQHVHNKKVHTIFMNQVHHHREAGRS